MSDPSQYKKYHLLVTHEQSFSIDISFMLLVTHEQAFSIDIWFIY